MLGSGLEASPALARPPRFRGALPLRRFLRLVRDSSIATWPDEAYESEFWEARFLWRRSFVANSPETVQHVLLDKAETYAKSALARRLLEPGIGRGLITAEGEEWRRQRRIMAPAFQHKRILAFAPAIAAAAERLSARWQRTTQPVDMAKEMSALTLAVIAEIMFSAGEDADLARIVASSERYQRAVRPGLLDLIGLPPWLPSGTTLRARLLFNETASVVTRLIAQRRAARSRHGDLLDLLMAPPESGDPPLTAREIRAQIATILTAGHETTANALTWTWYLLALHPAAEAKLHAELAGVLGGSTPRYDDLARLPYLRMVIEESLRLYPPAHTMSRQALAADTIAGYSVPKGATVLVVPWLLHRHRKLWDEPERFEPERMAPARAAARPRYAYIPFGAGPRICIGASLAMTEASLILATLAQRFRPRLLDAAAVEPVGLITLRPRNGMPMRLERR